MNIIQKIKHFFSAEDEETYYETCNCIGAEEFCPLCKVEEKDERCLACGCLLEGVEHIQMCSEPTKNIYQERK